MPDRLKQLKPDAGRRYLLAVRAGEESLHRNWIDANSERHFDLLVSYFGNVGGEYSDDGEYYHVMTGPPWPAYHEIMRNNPHLREKYDYVCFADDDLAAPASVWNALFICCDRHGFDLAQPAINGPISYPITAPVAGLRYRRTSFVENMCPVFSRRALAVCHATFGDSFSGWGISHIWPRLLAKNGSRLAIIDSVCVTHTRALRTGSLYKLLETSGVDPTSERNQVMANHGIEKADIRELSRVHINIWQAILYRLKPKSSLT